MFDFDKAINFLDCPPTLSALPDLTATEQRGLNSPSQDVGAKPNGADVIVDDATVNDDIGKINRYKADVILYNATVNIYNGDVIVDNGIVKLDNGDVNVDNAIVMFDGGIVDVNVASSRMTTSPSSWRPGVGGPANRRSGQFFAKR